MHARAQDTIDALGSMVKRTMQRIGAGLAMTLILGGCASAAVTTSRAPDASAAGMVDVATLVPDARIEMRYAGRDNFVGEPIRGYEAARCYLLRPAAEALARVQARLHAAGDRLLVFDCYRPVRAVRHFVEWAADPADQRHKSRYYPRLDKGALLGDYIAERSGHSRGATIDLGLLRCRTKTDCVPTDMGTDFDLFDQRAHTASPEVNADQRRNRQRLLQAMQAEGFANYPLEWWHFTFQPEPDPHTAYDFPVR